MPKKKPEPVLTHTELLCLAYRTLEQDVRHWEEALEKLPPEEKTEGLLSGICHDQLRKMDAIRTMYRLETGTEM